MLNPVRSILRKNETKDKYNILCAPTHERYETGLCLTGHNFYAMRSSDVKDWNIQYGKIPKNYTLLNPKLGSEQVLPFINFDFVLSQNKFGQYQMLKPVADALHIPLISLEHTLPIPSWSPEIRAAVKSMTGNINVFISSFSIKEWGFDDVPNTRVVHHMVDSDIFQIGVGKRENVILSVVNDWINREWCCNFLGWTRITKGLPVKVLGDTPGFSKPASSINELSKTYQLSRVFLNTSVISPIPTALLEAMSCGCACVSTATCMIPEIIEHGVDGFISNDEDELRRYCELLLRDESLAKKIGLNAAQKIRQNFNKDTFIKEWNVIFNEVASKTFIGE